MFHHQLKCRLEFSWYFVVGSYKLGHVAHPLFQVEFYCTVDTSSLFLQKDHTSYMHKKHPLPMLVMFIKLLIQSRRGEGICQEEN